MKARFSAPAMVRLALAAAVLIALVWRLGAEPFLEGLRLVDAQTLAIALVIGAITTVCCAWRWSVVSRALGVELTMRQATAAYYRSIFLNTTLPGGVVGDVHRAFRHGRDAGDLGRGMRSVAWERGAGQVIQLALTIVLLICLPSPVRTWMPAAFVALALALAVIAVLAVHQSRRHGTRVARGARTLVDDIRLVLGQRRAWLVVILTSLIAVAGHAIAFIVAARTAGTPATTADLIPITLLVLAAMAVPLSIAGWGPREGVAAWAFAAAGLGAAAGVTTAVIFGVMTLVAGLPGAAVLAVTSTRHHSIVREEALHG